MKIHPRGGVKEGNVETRGELLAGLNSNMADEVKEDLGRNGNLLFPTLLPIFSFIVLSDRSVIIYKLEETAKDESGPIPTLRGKVVRK